MTSFWETPNKHLALGPTRRFRSKLIQILLSASASVISSECALLSASASLQKKVVFCWFLLAKLPNLRHLIEYKDGRLNSVVCKLVDSRLLAVGGTDRSVFGDSVCRQKGRWKRVASGWSDHQLCLWCGNYHIPRHFARLSGTLIYEYIVYTECTACPDCFKFIIKGRMKSLHVAAVTRV